MGREAQGENSSSQNVNLEVTDIRRGAQGEVVSFGFSDGSSFFIHPQAAVEYSIRIGAAVTESMLTEIQARSAVLAATDKAVDYLARREHSSSEIILKLQKKGYDRETAVQAVELCSEKGYIDDRRFAELWVESRLKNHPEGRSCLAAGLARKGVPREIASAVLDECVDDEMIAESLKRCLDKYIRTRSAEPRKAVNHLLRKGFRYADIRRQMAGLDEFAEENNLEYREYD